MMSMRADFLGELQKDGALYDTHLQINVPPVREAQLREVVGRPAELLSARFETDGLADFIARRTAAESAKDAGALPLLSYLLEDMWAQMVHRGDGVLCLPAQTFDLGCVLVERADAFVARHPKAEATIRRIFNLLVTVREGEEPTRRRASRSEFSSEEWQLVTELANDPNRLLISAMTEGGETYAEVAHEAIFRRWDKLATWIAIEREFLVWRTSLEAARRMWLTTPDRFKNDALLSGFALEQARSWLTNRGEDLPSPDRKFIELSMYRLPREKARRLKLIGAISHLGFAGLPIATGAGTATPFISPFDLVFFMVSRQFGASPAVVIDPAHRIGVVVGIFCAIGVYVGSRVIAILGTCWVGFFTLLGSIALVYVALVYLPVRPSASIVALKIIPYWPIFLATFAGVKGTFADATLSRKVAEAQKEAKKGSSPFATSFVSSRRADGGV
jgi:hypothetical protein